VRSGPTSEGLTADTSAVATLSSRNYKPRATASRGGYELRGSMLYAAQLVQEAARHT
jgi:hypothetical protein